MKKKIATSLTFDLSNEQLKVLTGADVTNAQFDGQLEESYRPWNAAFVDCNEPYNLPPVDRTDAYDLSLKDV